MRFFFAFFGIDECNGDVTSAIYKMSVAMNIFVVPLAAGVLALGVVVYSFFSNVDFYPGRHPKPDAKPLPKWYGRLLFAVIGLVLIFTSLFKIQH
jgi:uncharacterized BrkB/YihY/UPF0761 family membrane protein